MKLSSRKIRIFITIFSNLKLRFVIALCGFIITPLIISHYGSTINCNIYLTFLLFKLYKFAKKFKIKK